MPVPRAMTSPRRSLPLENSRPKGQWVLDAGQSCTGLRRQGRRPCVPRNPPHEAFDFHHHNAIRPSTVSRQSEPISPN